MDEHTAADLLRRLVARRHALTAAGGGLDGEARAIDRAAQRLLTSAGAGDALLESVLADSDDEWSRGLARLYLVLVDATKESRRENG